MTTDTTLPPPLELAPSSLAVKLDFGCGNTPKDGFEGVDLHGDKAKHRVDLFKFPFPWGDNSVDEIWCSHFVEHIPAREVEERDIAIMEHVAIAGDSRPATLYVNGVNEERRSSLIGKDFFFAFFDECHRILKPGGWMEVVIPCLRSDRAFQDPTHRRFIPGATFWYLSRAWRAANVPQYPVRCDFEPHGMNDIIPGDIGLRTPEVQGELIRTRWNIAIDTHVKLKCVK